MKKMKKLTILAVVAVMTAFVGLGGGQALANTLVVDDYATQCPGAGFVTIGAALAVASSGDTIEVCPGLYNEAVTIVLSGITLIGQPAPGAILDGTGLADTDNCITIAVGVSDVTIERLEIRECNNRGIRGLGMHSSIKLKDLDIHAVSQAVPGTDGHAVDFVSSGDVKIEDVSIAVGPGAGFLAEAIRLQSVSDVVVDHVHTVGGFVGVNFACTACDGSEPPTNGVVKYSSISGTFDNGVLLANTTEARVEHNVIAGAGFVGIQVGFIVATPVTGAEIVQNVVTGVANAPNPPNHGIALTRGSSGSTVKENIVTGSLGDGVFIGVLGAGSSSGNTIEQNFSNGNAGFGYLDDGSGAANVFIGNDCKANTAGGSLGPGGPGTLCGPQF